MTRATRLCRGTKARSSDQPPGQISSNPVSFPFGTGLHWLLEKQGVVGRKQEQLLLPWHDRGSCLHDEVTRGCPGTMTSLVETSQ